MSTLIENVAKVKRAHAALKTAISAKGVTVPDGAKLSDMPALVGEIQAMPPPTGQRMVFASDTATSIVVQNPMVVDMTTVEDLSRCFNSCTSLKSLTLPSGFGQNATNLGHCFYYCLELPSLTLPSGFGQNATNVEYCFGNCPKLTTLTLPSGFGQNATNIGYCFSNCPKLTTLTLPSGFGQNATNIGLCFYSCKSLTSLTLPAGFGRNATYSNNCFGSCTSLTDITGSPIFKVSVSLRDCVNLTHDSLMVVINGLQTVTSAQTLTLGTTNLAKLTDAEKKVATDKGWTLA